MTTRVRMVTAAFTLALATPAGAQDTAPGAVGGTPVIEGKAGLSLQEAIARALDREPSLRAARAEVEAARGLRQQAALRPNPTVRFERREEPTGTDSQTAAGVQWPLDLFRRTGRIQTADREVEATGFAASDRERTLAAQVRRQYGRAAAAARDLHVAEEVLAAATSQLDLVRARVASGRTPPLERDLLEVERQRVESTRLLLAGRVEVSLVELRRLLGMAPDEPLQLRDTIESLVAGSSAPPAVREAVALRPDIREAQARVALADARIEQATREGRVDVTLFADYMRMDAGFPQQGVGVAGALERVRGRFHYVAGGAMVTVPLFDRGQGRVAAARAGRAAADARRDAAELAARAEIAAARASDARAQQAMALYSDSIRALARQNHDVVRQAFDLGRATVFDVLSEQRRLLEIEQGYTAALREAWDARVALTRALGETR